MPGSPRADEAGGLYHALNRANLGAKIFRKEGDFIAFEKVLDEALQIHNVELFAYQIMSTHWHLVLRPLRDGEMGRFCKWVGGRTRCDTTLTTRQQEKATFTRDASRVFRFKMTITSLLFAGTSNAMRYAPKWLLVRKSGFLTELQRETIRPTRTCSCWRTQLLHKMDRDFASRRRQPSALPCSTEYFYQRPVVESCAQTGSS